MPVSTIILGVVTDIVYGCEAAADEMLLIKKVAGLLVDEPDEYRSILQDGLRMGMSFPSARQAACEKLLPSAAAGAKNIVGISREFALACLMGSDVLLESDRLINCQLDRIAVTVRVGFQPLMSGATAVLAWT